MKLQKEVTEEEVGDISKEMNKTSLPGVPAWFLLFLATEPEGGAGLGLGLVFGSSAEKPAMEAEMEKGSPDIFICAEKYYLRIQSRGCWQLVCTKTTKLSH